MNLQKLDAKSRQQELKEIEEHEKKDIEQSKKSPFGRWTQFNNEHTQELIWLALKHPKAHAILLFLVDQMDGYNAVVCSMQTIQEVLAIGRTTATLAIKVLKENGFIAVLKSGKSNVYAINDSVYWKSWSNKKQYSKFPANVILSLSEQEEEVKITFKDIGYTLHKEVKIKR